MTLACLAQEVELPDAFRRIRLSICPGDLGLSCSETGLRLAETPLLRKLGDGFEPRPVAEIGALMNAAFGAAIDSIRLMPGLEVIARALSAGEVQRAMIAAMRLDLPDLTEVRAARLARVDERLAKYNPQEPRDSHGRWTTGRGGAPTASRPKKRHAKPAVRRSRHANGSPSASRAPPTPAKAIPPARAAPPAVPPAPDGPGSDRRALEMLYPTLVSQFDDLGPAEFSRRVTSIGQWLEANGRSLTTTERVKSRALYVFLQDRLSFWLSYKYKTPIEAGDVLSAASILFQGANNGRIINFEKDGLPESMLAVAAGAMIFDSPGPVMRAGRYFVEPAFPPSLRSRLAVGGIVHNDDVGIVWGRGIAKQGEPWEVYKGNQGAGRWALPPDTTTFDEFIEPSGRAISDKTMDTTSYSYSSNPSRIYNALKTYTDAAADYSKPRRPTDLDPNVIKSREIHLAVPDTTAPEQWDQIARAIEYGKSRGVHVEVTIIKSSRDVGADGPAKAVSAIGQILGRTPRSLSGIAPPRRDRRKDAPVP
jgi:hypothetical protein